MVAGVRCLGVSPVCPPHSQVLAHKEGSGGAVHPSASGFFVFVFFFSLSRVRSADFQSCQLDSLMFYFNSQTVE